MAVGVDGGADDLVARPDLDGDGLAGDHGHVDGRVPVDDDAVGGDLLAGPHHEPHADLELVERDLASVVERGGLGAELGQLAQRVARSAAGAGLEPRPSRISVMITAAVSK